MNINLICMPTFFMKKILSGLLLWIWGELFWCFIQSSGRECQNAARQCDNDDTNTGPNEPVAYTARGYRFVCSRSAENIGARDDDPRIALGGISILLDLTWRRRKSKAQYCMVRWTVWIIRTLKKYALHLSKNELKHFAGLWPFLLYPLSPKTKAGQYGTTRPCF